MTVLNDRNHFSRDTNQLLQRLNPHCAKALEAAASLCQGRLSDEITVEHWLLKLIEAGGGDIPAIMPHYDLNIDAVWDALLRAIDHTPRNVRGRSSLSPQLAAILQDAWFIASSGDTSGDPVIRSGNILQAIIEAPHALRANHAWQLLSVSSAQIPRLLPRLAQRTCENQTQEQEQEPEALCLSRESGARNVDEFLNQRILPTVSRELLTRMASGAVPARIALSSSPEGNLTIDFIDRGETDAQTRVPELPVG